MCWRLTHTQRHQDVLLGQELDIVTRLRWARVHEVSTLLVQPSNLKQVDNIMDIGLDQAEGHDGTGQVRMAMEIVGLAGEHGVNIGVAAGSEQVVHTATVLIFAVPRQTVRDDGGQGPHVWEAGPQPVVSGHMRGV